MKILVNRDSRWGWFAIIWMCLLILANLWNAYEMIRFIPKVDSPHDPRWPAGFYWMLRGGIALSVIGASACGLLLSGRKIGFSILVVVSIIGAIVDLSWGVPPYFAFLKLLAVIVLWFAIKSRWEFL